MVIPGKGKGGFSKGCCDNGKKTTTTNKTSQRTTDDAMINQMIKEKAYFIWEKEGKPHGKDADIWLKAEKEIRSRCR